MKKNKKTLLIVIASFALLAALYVGFIFLRNYSQLQQVRAEHAVYEGEFIFAAVCNTASLGGILKLKPETVCISDGALECLLIRMPKTVQELAEILVNLRTMEYNTPLMHFFRTSHIVFQTPEKLDWSLDGEHAVSRSHAEIRVLPRAVKLILPKKRRAGARNAQSSQPTRRVSVKKKR